MSNERKNAFLRLKSFRIGGSFPHLVRERRQTDQSFTETLRLDQALARSLPAVNLVEKQVKAHRRRKAIWS
jgi:hypothetical protein